MTVLYNMNRDIRAVPMLHKVVTKYEYVQNRQIFAMLCLLSHTSSQSLNKMYLKNWTCFIYMTLKTDILITTRRVRMICLTSSNVQPHNSQSPVAKRISLCHTKQTFLRYFLDIQLQNIYKISRIQQYNVVKALSGYI